MCLRVVWVVQRGNTALFALLPGGDTAVPDWRLVLLLVASGADLTAKHPQVRRSASCGSETS